MEHKKFGLKVSSLKEDGTFSGILSAYGNIDAGGDVVMPGAYTKTIQESGGKCVMCWQHDQKDPIGVLFLKDTGENLEVEGKFNLAEDVPTARRGYSMMKFLDEHGLKMGLSIGYEIVRREIKDGVRYLKEIRLMEGSPVTTPMNELCVVTSVKSIDGAKDFSSSLEAIQLWSSKYHLLRALEESLDDALYSGDDAAEVTASVQRSLDQFASTYMEWLPKMLTLWGLKEIPQPDQKAGRSISSASRTKIEAAISKLQELLGGTSADAAAKAGPDIPAAPDSEAIHSAISRISAISLR